MKLNWEPEAVAITAPVPSSASQVSACASALPGSVNVPLKLSVCPRTPLAGPAIVHRCEAEVGGVAGSDRLAVVSGHLPEEGVRVVHTRIGELTHERDRLSLRDGQIESGVGGGRYVCHDYGRGVVAEPAVFIF